MIPWISVCLTCIAQHSSSAPAVDLHAGGAFGFPQKHATVLCDTPELRFSVCSDGTYFFAQAVLWQDDDDALGATADGRKIGDRATLELDLDADGLVTRDVDRVYHLDPWPALLGMHYTVLFDERSSGFLTGDSRGRGAVRHVDVDGGRVRVDTYLVPLEELQLEAGDSMRFAYSAKSPAPNGFWNSVGHVPLPGPSRALPRDKWHTFTVSSEGAVPAIDIQLVPEGRESIAMSAKHEQPRVGTSVGEAGGPPEIAAKAWLNWKGDAPPTLASLRGKVVVVEFWATWCGPCVAGIPHLDELHDKHARDGLVILSLTDQEPGPVEKFVARKGDGMSYAVGAESTATADYGVTAIPHAFVIGRDGKLVWSGLPASAEFDQAVQDALKAK